MRARELLFHTIASAVLWAAFALAIWLSLP